MQITGVQVIVGFAAGDSYSVEFVEERGAVVSVVFPPSGYGVNRTNAVQTAKAALEQLIRENALPDEMADGKNQDGRAATMAASLAPSSRNPPKEPQTEDHPSSLARDAVEGHDSQPQSDTQPDGGSTGGGQVNQDATPGTGLLPDPDSDDLNMQPSS